MKAKRLEPPDPYVDYEADPFWTLVEKGICVNSYSFCITRWE